MRKSLPDERPRQIRVAQCPPWPGRIRAGRILELQSCTDETRRRSSAMQIGEIFQLEVAMPVHSTVKRRHPASGFRLDLRFSSPSVHVAN